MEVVPEIETKDAAARSFHVISFPPFPFSFLALVYIYEYNSQLLHHSHKDSKAPPNPTA